MASVLLVDDDRSVRHLLTKALEPLGVEVVTADRAEAGLEIVRTNVPDVVLLDIMLPGMSGLDCFRQLQELDRRVPVIFITAADSSETAIAAMQLGAYDYLMKPLDLPKVQNLVERAIETRRLMSVPVGITTKETPTSADTLVGRSEAMLAVYGAVGRVANQDVTVLIRGESGTGKELVARAVYQHSQRSTGRFLAVNCAALPDNLLESELFGHEKGAFTGADQKRIGKFEQCSGGTIFLDEVGDMSPLTQGKVLRLLQEQKFERVGGNQTIETDVRIIAATNRDLDQMVANNEFRGDLLYRLNGFTIRLPPLRERGADVETLIEYFLSRFARELGKRVDGISPEAAELLRSYSWPGNVRELQSVIRRALLNSTGPVIVPEFLPDEVKAGAAPAAHSAPATRPAATASPAATSAHSAAEGSPPQSNLETVIGAGLVGGSVDLYTQCQDFMERYLFKRVLESTGGNQSQAARILGITRGRLRNRMRALNMSIEPVVE